MGRYFICAISLTDMWVSKRAHMKISPNTEDTFLTIGEEELELLNSLKLNNLAAIAKLARI